MKIFRNKEIVPVASVNKSERPVIVAGPGTSEETKDLIDRIDKLETENVKLEEDKLELAKAVKDMNEALKEAQRIIKVQEQQINDAERQGAEIIPLEVVEKKQAKATAVKKKKTLKNKNADEEEDEDDEPDAFKDNPEVKKMVEDLVPEEDREDDVKDAERIMMIQSSNDEELVKKIKQLSKENELLQKSLENLKNQKSDEDGDENELESLRDQNSAYISKIKSLNKKIEDLENRPEREDDLSAERPASVAAAAAPSGENYDHLNKAIEELKEQNHDLEEKIAILEEENIHKTDDYNREKERADRLDDELAELRKNYADLAKQKAGSKDATDQSDAILQTQIASLMSENEELKDQIKMLDKKGQPTKRLEVKLDKKDREIERLHQKIEQLENKLDAAEASNEPPAKKGKKAGQGAASSDARALKNKEKEIAKLKSKLEKLEDRNETLTITADARKEEIRNLQAITKDQERELKSLKSDVVAAGKDKDKSLKKKEKETEKEKAAALAKEKELQSKLEKNKGKMTAENEQLKKEMKDMMEEYEAKIKILKDQSSMLNQQVDENETSIKKKDKEIKELLKKLENMSEEVGEAQNLLGEHKDLKKKHKELTNEFDVMEVKYKEEVKKRKKLHNQIEDIKGKIRVFARARPMNKNEKAKECGFAVTIPDEMTILVDTKNGPKKYNFDN